MIFNRGFFYDTPNQLSRLLPEYSGMEGCLRLIRVDSFRPGHHLDLVMDDQAGKLAAYLEVDG